MGKLFDLVSEQNTLFSAWRHIRSNGIGSKSEDTRKAIDAFDEDPVRNIRSLQSHLRNQTFEFDFQTGILKKKSNGKLRGIVLASVRNRIVERALLDVLQEKCDFIQAVNSCATSVGGVPNRSVPHGIKLIQDAFNSGKGYFVRSDIAGFFDNVPRQSVMEFLKNKISDNKFLDLLARATTVTLANEEALGENRAAFPVNDKGVAQGSPLSSLFGNIILTEFDRVLNNEKTICVRFIDDFVILGVTADDARLAFNNAESILQRLGLQCKNPYEEKCDPAKADFGKVADKIIFLGHQIEPGLLQPSRDARLELLAKVRSHIACGRAAIKEVKSSGNSFGARSRYTQTLDMVDRVIGGWAQAFAYCNATNTFDDLDKKIDEEIGHFRNFFREQSDGLDWKGKRRLLGVRLVGDVPRSSFEELPTLIKANDKYIRSGSTTVSTDGSIYKSKRQSGDALAPGGWAFVTHDSNVSGAGWERETTNNRMELLAVIKALECYPEGPIIIRTDSQYVEKTAKGKQTTKKNRDLWDRYQKLTEGRKVRVDWIKGHSGDKYNEQADQMANAQAKLAANSPHPKNSKHSASASSGTVLARAVSSSS